jgi:hypothetical protein
MNSFAVVLQPAWLIQGRDYVLPRPLGEGRGEGAICQGIVKVWNVRYFGTSVIQ